MVDTVVIAPDSFKGSLSARQVAAAIADGWRSVRPNDELVLLPQADGGEGTLDAVEAAIPASVRRSAGDVTGPDGRPTPGQWLQLPGGVAVIELADTSGLPLMGELDPRGATTRGLGEVARAALEAGAASLVITLGGSASTDGGAGALQALGLRLLDDAGHDLPAGGAALARLHSIDATDLLAPPAAGVLLLTDVDAPLTGERGAAAVFGPQKGATVDDIDELDAALARFAEVLGSPALADTPGTGAAGGCAFGLAAAWGGRIVPGAGYLAELSGLPEMLATADVVITGEGRFDEQSLGGKVVGQLLDRARVAGVRAGVIAGQVSADPGVWSASLVELSGSVASAIADPETWLRAAGAAAASALGEATAT